MLNIPRDKKYTITFADTKSTFRYEETEYQLGTARFFGDYGRYVHDTGMRPFQA